MRKEAARKEDGPPRASISRSSCGNNHIAAAEKKKHEKIIDIRGSDMNQVAVLDQDTQVATQKGFTRKQIDILKNSICRGVTDEEFETFLMACHKTQLDPFMRQIYAVKRKARKPDGTWGEVMSIQTGIDGYRLIAERTERYAPGPEPTYVHNEQGELVSATAYIKKQTRDGTWHTVSASAYMDEYCQKGREGQRIGMWATMPKTMLSKCAESQALRKAFPAEMSGVYTKEEMAQADVEDVSIVAKISPEQASDLQMILDECDEAYRKWLSDYLKKQYKTDNLCDLPREIYDRMKAAATKNMEQNHAKQREQQQQASQELVAAEIQ